jgi:tetratricopeptide (TPR) repeat protein
MRKRCLGLLLLTVLAHAAARAERDTGYTDSPVLPAYCRDTRDGTAQDPGRVAHYRRIYGDLFGHMHHYCRGLYAFHQALMIRDDRMLREAEYGTAVREFDYVLASMAPDSILKPELLTRKGTALRALGSNAEAGRCFAQAMQLQPDYLPAYVALANHFVQLGAPDEAARVLREGLVQVPGAAILERKLAALDELASPGRP